MLAGCGGAWWRVVEGREWQVLKKEKDTRFSTCSTATLNEFVYKYSTSALNASGVTTGFVNVTCSLSCHFPGGEKREKRKR